MKNDHMYRSKGKNGRTPEGISEEIDLYSISSQIHFPCKFNLFFPKVFINFCSSSSPTVAKLYRNLNEVKKEEKKL